MLLDNSFVYPPIPSILIGVIRPQLTEYRRTLSCCICQTGVRHRPTVQSRSKDMKFKFSITHPRWPSRTVLPSNITWAVKMDAVKATINPLCTIVSRVLIATSISFVEIVEMNSLHVDVGQRINGRAHIISSPTKCFHHTYNDNNNRY